MVSFRQIEGIYDLSLCHHLSPLWMQWPDPTLPNAAELRKSLLAFSHSLTPTFIIELLPIKYPPTRPSPRQGRRLGPPEVWNLLCHGHGLHIVQGRSCNKCLSVFKRFAKLQRPHLPAHSPLLLRHSSLPFARLQTLKTLKTLKTLQFPRGSFHQALWPSALLFQHCSLPFACT